MAQLPFAIILRPVDHTVLLMKIAVLSTRSTPNYVELRIPGSMNEELEIPTPFELACIPAVLVLAVLGARAHDHRCYC